MIFSSNFCVWYKRAVFFRAKNNWIFYLPCNEWAPQLITPSKKHIPKVSVKRWSFNGYVRLVKPALSKTQQRSGGSGAANAETPAARVWRPPPLLLSCSARQLHPWENLSLFQLSLRVETREYGRRQVNKECNQNNQLKMKWFSQKSDKKWQLLVLDWSF